jgi:ribose transport system permease protein
VAERQGTSQSYLLVPILSLAVLLAIAVIRGPTLVSLSGLGSAILVAAPLIMATYALMSLAIAGRGTVDLAVGPLVAFINVSVVTVNGLELVTSPIGVFVVALGIGVIYQVLFALLILFVRVQPIIVALSGFLALSGINLVIMPRPGGAAPDWMSSWGLGTTIFSPILLIILIATACWLLFTLTPFYANLRLMGYDERAAYTSGVRIYAARAGAHVIAGLFEGLGGLCYTALISSGDPTQGTTLTLTSVTALVLGGVSLAGGRGGVTGALLGALNLFLIGYVLSTFDFGGVQAFVTQLFYGLILIASLMLMLLIPVISRYLSFISPFGSFLVLGLIDLAIMLQVMTGANFGTPVAHAASAAPGLIGRYLFFSPTIAAAGHGWVASALQKTLLSVVAALGLITLTLRVMVAEARSRRFGVFLYTAIGILLVMLLLVVSLESHAMAIAGLGR